MLFKEFVVHISIFVLKFYTLKLEILNVSLDTIGNERLVCSQLPDQSGSLCQTHGI